MRTVLLALVLALSATAAVTGCSKGEKQEAAEIPNLSLDEVETGLEAKQLYAVDCNNDSTRKKWGIIPGAILISDEDKFEASALPPDKSAKLVFYCSGPG